MKDIVQQEAAVRSQISEAKHIDLLRPLSSIDGYVITSQTKSHHCC